MLEAYIDWITHSIQLGAESFLLTFMFKQLNGSELSKKRQMIAEIESVYGRMLNYVIRRPHKRPLDEHPRWFIAFDWPVAKNDRGPIDPIKTNDGLHVHVIVVMPQRTHMKVSLADHIADRQEHYAGRDRKILTLHAKPLERTPRAAAAYVLKQLDRGRIDVGEIVVLPKHKSEMTAFTKQERRDYAASRQA